MTLHAKGQEQRESRISAEFIQHDLTLLPGISEGLEYDEQRAKFQIRSRSQYVASF